MFEHLADYDWDSFRALLSTDIERIGPFGERLVGRDAYVELMTNVGQQPPDGRRTTWDIRVVATHKTGDRPSRVLMPMCRSRKC